MTLRAPGYRNSKKSGHVAWRDLVVRQYSPQEVYGALLWYADFMKWQPGWAAHCFKEIYGTWPKDNERGDQMVCIGTVIEKWIAQRPKKARKK